MDKKNILSIDIDYILEPFIEYCEKAWSSAPFYTTHTFKEGLDKPTLIFDRMHDMAPLIKKTSSISQKNFMEVLEIFSQALFSLKKTEHNKLYFADNHDTILTPLQELYDSIDQYKQDDTKFSIINFDHHHDIYYNEDQARDVDMYNLVSPGDWMWYLDKVGIVNDYHWVGNENSQPWTDKMGTGAPTYMQNGSHCTSLEALRKSITIPKTFDLIYVCKSPQWTPDIYFDYFEMLKKLAKDYFNKDFTQDRGFFCGSRTSKKWGSKANNKVELDQQHIDTNKEVKELKTVVSNQLKMGGSKGDI
jgi:hypothetical protein